MKTLLVQSILDLTICPPRSRERTDTRSHLRCNSCIRLYDHFPASRSWEEEHPHSRSCHGMGGSQHSGRGGWGQGSALTSLSDQQGLDCLLVVVSCLSGGRGRRPWREEAACRPCGHEHRGVQNTPFLEGVQLSLSTAQWCLLHKSVLFC